jgi:putative ABC transport system ATP-binding protein
MVIDVLLKVSEELGAALVVSTHDPLVSDHLSIQWAMHDGVLGPPDRTGPTDQR